jgi:hypothetical protein
LGDYEAPTWREFTAQVAAPLGIPIEAVTTLPFTKRAPVLQERVDGWRKSRVVQGTLDRLPQPLRTGLAAAWAASGALPPERNCGLEADFETALLHRAAQVPRWDKARERLGFAPVITSEEGWRGVRAWLAFAGYPVVAP